jgi:hypothetical protein
MENVTAQVRQMKRSPAQCALCGQTDWLKPIVNGWGRDMATKLKADSRGVYEAARGQCVVGVCNRCYHEGCWSCDVATYANGTVPNLGKALECRVRKGAASGVWFQA